MNAPHWSSPCRRARRGTVRPARHSSTRCPRHQHTRVRQTRRSRSLLIGHSPASVRRLPLRRKAAPQRQCCSSSVGEAGRGEPAVVCQQPRVVRSTQFGDRRRSRPRGRRECRNRGKGIASPDQPREPKQSWRPQGPTGLDVRDHDRAPSLLNPDSEQTGSHSCVGRDRTDGSPRSRSSGCCSARAKRSSHRCRDKRCSVSSAAAEILCAVGADASPTNAVAQSRSGLPAAASTRSGSLGAD